MRELERAIKELQAQLSDNPEDLRSLLRLGDLFLRAGRVNDAVGCYWRAADVYERDGYFLKAVAVCKQIARADPGQREPVRAALTRLGAALGLPLEALLPQEKGRGR